MIQVENLGVLHFPFTYSRTQKKKERKIKFIIGISIATCHVASLVISSINMIIRFTKQNNLEVLGVNIYGWQEFLFFELLNRIYMCIQKINLIY